MKQLFITGACLFLWHCTDAQSGQTGSEPSGFTSLKSHSILIRAHSTLKALVTATGHFSRNVEFDKATCASEVAALHPTADSEQATKALVAIPQGNDWAWALVAKTNVLPTDAPCEIPYRIANARKAFGCPTLHFEDQHRLRATASSLQSVQVLRRLGDYALIESNGSAKLISNYCIQSRWPGPNEYTLPQYMELTRRRFAELDVLAQEMWHDVKVTTPDFLDRTSGMVENYIAEAKDDEDCATCFMGPFNHDPEVTRALLLNILSTRYHYRNSGLAYAIHPAALSYYILEFAEHLMRLEDLQQILVLGNTHDVIEELLRQFAAGRKDTNPWLTLLSADQLGIEQVRILKDTINTMFPVEWRIGDRVVLMMEPVLRHPDSPGSRFREIADEMNTTEFIVEHSLFAHMMRGVRDLQIATTKVADRIDFFMDYDFIFRRADRRRAREQLAENLARGYWVLAYLLNVQVDEWKNGLPLRATVGFKGFPQALLDLAYAMMDHVLYHDPRIDELLLANRIVEAMSKQAFILYVRSLIAEFERIVRHNQPRLNAIVFDYLDDLDIPSAANFYSAS